MLSTRISAHLKKENFLISLKNIFLLDIGLTNGYLCYDLDSGKILISRDVIFLESDFSASLTLHNSEDN